MRNIPDKLTIDDDGRIAPKVEQVKSDIMMIEVNGKREVISMNQAWTLVMQILYQLRMHSEQHRRN